jgi:hypothetical protein
LAKNPPVGLRPARVLSVAQEWKASYADAVVGDDRHGSGTQIFGDIVQVSEDEGSLFLGWTTMTGTEQNHRRLRCVRQSEERSEIGITGNNNTFLLAGQNEEFVILRAFKSQLKGVDGVMASLAEKLGQLR